MIPRLSMMYRNVCVSCNYRLLLLFIMSAILHAGCASITDGRTLKVSTQDLEDSQYQPQEVSRMLESLGYQWLPVHDPDLGHPAKVAEINGQYRMLFQARAVPAIHVEVNIRVNGDTLGLHVYETGHQGLSERAMHYYHELKRRLVIEYGPDNVSDSSALLTP